MLGERIPAAEVTDRGLAGDRRLALLDRETGKVASAKTPRLWRSLLTCAAALTGPATRITGPAGETLLSTDAGVDDVLSAIVGRPVTLTDRPPAGATLDRSRPEEVLGEGLDAEVAADVVRFGSASPPGTFFDFAPVHLLTTATLDRLAALGPRGVAEAERYRPNLVIDTPGTGFVEDGWVGRELRIGDRLVLRVVASTPRCAVPTLAHGALPRDADALRTPAVHNRVPALAGRSPEPCVGVYAQVLRPGPVREGDDVRF
ncbi:MOSC domain-containing protein [Kitasatospora sp. NPDC057015]|uniref:MOSC domain-containing protein n=1 Tax=Kitasatospora sp. NPDC057015 TaxID=3346001 RepID=UPI003645C834